MKLASRSAVSATERKNTSRRSEREAHTKTQVRMSFTASLRPYLTPCSASGSDTRSLAMRSTATCRSSSVKNHLAKPLFPVGKSGSNTRPRTPAAKLAAPSRMNSHRQPLIPWTPSSPSKMPAAIRPEKAVARMRPEYRTAMRRASCLRGYQLLSRNKAPGKKGASTIPRKKRMAMS